MIESGSRVCMNIGPPGCCQLDRILTGMSAVHDPDYRESWKDWQSFVDILSEKIAEVDETVPELPAKDLVTFLEGLPRLD